MRTGVLFHLATCSTLTLAATAAAQAPIYSNGSTDPSVVPLATGPVTTSGVAAPPGQLWSEAARDASGAAVAIAGFAGHQTEGTLQAFRFADDFVIPDTERWRIEEIEFFVYPTGVAPGLWPFGTLRVRIWNGRPDAPTSRVIFGGEGSNQLAGAAPTNMIRVFNTITGPQPPTPDLSRRIWKARATVPGIVLRPGQYWLDWQFESSASIQGLRALTPPLTIPGLRSRTKWNALQAQPGLALSWKPLVDPGKPASAPDGPQDLPFVLKGSVVPVACGADANGDRRIDNADLSIVLANWNTSVPPGTAGDGNSDGRVDNADLSMLLAAFNSAC